MGYGTGDRFAARTQLIHLGLACVVNGALEPIHHSNHPGKETA